MAAANAREIRISYGPLKQKVRLPRVKTVNIGARLRNEIKTTVDLVGDQGLFLDYHSLVDRGSVSETEMQERLRYLNLRTGQLIAGKHPELSRRLAETTQAVPNLQKMRVMFHSLGPKFEGPAPAVVQLSKLKMAMQEEYPRFLKAHNLRNNADAYSLFCLGVLHAWRQYGKTFVRERIAPNQDFLSRISRGENPQTRALKNLGQTLPVPYSADVRITPFSDLPPGKRPFQLHPGAKHKFLEFLDAVGGELFVQGAHLTSERSEAVENVRRIQAAMQAYGLSEDALLPRAPATRQARQARRLANLSARIATLLGGRRS